MIQRIQSLFLLLAAMCAGATWLFPVQSFALQGRSITYMTYGIHDDKGMTIADAALPVPFHIIHTVVAVVLVICIFLYAKRLRQARVVRGLWLMALVVAVLQFISGNSLQAYMANTGEWQRSYGVSFFLPLGVVLFAFLAER
ncbi:MAG TPA: DUF4293 family protein, partial [Flavobacteriales bacterium]|nr:DUF4293 family protein [Flavobacteriales bacterium]